MDKWQFRWLAVLALVFGLASPSANAGVVTYEFRLTVTNVTISDDCAGLDALVRTFGCDWSPGDQITGRFQLLSDTSTLADGIYSFIPLTLWSLEIGEILWDTTRSSDFSEFRDGAYCDGPGTYFSLINPGLVVRAGEIIGFCGGALNSSDSVFIDFDYLYGPGAFGATDGGPVFLRGIYAISRVSEPAASLLVTLALLLAGLASRDNIRREL